MKKSNIIMVVLAFVFISGFIGNIYYHRCQFAPVKDEYKKIANLHKICASCKVLWLYGDSVHILPYLNVRKVNAYAYFGDSVLSRSLEFSYKGHGDTLFVQAFSSNDIAHRKDSSIVLNLREIKQVYMNGKLIKQF